MKLSSLPFRLSGLIFSRGRSVGVAIYLRNDFPPPFIYFDFPAQYVADTLWLPLPLRHSDALRIAIVYRSPSNDLEKDCELLKSIRDFILFHHCSHLLLLGDFNAPDIMWDEGASAGGFLLVYFTWYRNRIGPNMSANPHVIVLDSDPLCST